MSKKTGVIIATTGIVVILLSLIGFTYGFFASLISGNESSKNVTLQAGESEVTFNDLSVEETNDIIAPGYTNTKFFTVQNTGEVSASYYIHLVDVINEYTRKQDIVYTLYRKVGDSRVEPENVDVTVDDFSDWENVSSSRCPINSEFPDYGDCQYLASSGIVINEMETIEEPENYYVYAFVVEYINHQTIDQIDDEGKIFSGRIKIFADEAGTLKSPYMTGTLADAIFDNALAGENGTTYSETPITTPGKVINNSNESTLSASTDNDGTTYYFRGNVQDNYLNFNGMCWRIVRINGDDSVKLIMEDRFAECDDDNDSDGAKYTGNWAYTESQNDVDSIFKENGNYTENGNKLDFAKKCYDPNDDEEVFSNKYDINGYIIDENILKARWQAYYDNSANEPPFYYLSSFIRLKFDKNPTFKCLDNSVLNTKSTNITADEVAFAGAVDEVENTSYYLINSYQINNTKAFVTSSSYGFYTFTPGTSSYIVSSEGKLLQGIEEYYDVDGAASDRIVVNLKKGTMISPDSGNGLRTNPYRIG